VELDDRPAHDSPPQREAEWRKDGTVCRLRDVRDEIDTVKAPSGAVDLIAGLDDHSVLGEARHASERVSERQPGEVDDVEPAQLRYRLPNEIVIDLFRLTGAADESDVPSLGQERQRRPRRPFHVEADREDREAGRRLQVADAALVHTADDDRGSRP